MNIKQAFKMTALAVAMFSCGSDEKPVRTAADKEKEMKSVIRSLEYGYKKGWVSNPNSYAVNGEPQFAIVDFDSAGIHARVLLDRDAAYDFLMKRQGLNKKGQAPQYILDDAYKTKTSCSGSTKPSVTLAILAGDKSRAFAPRHDTTQVNLKELEIYRQYGHVMSAESYQCDSDNNYNRFPSYTLVKDKDFEFRTNLGSTLDDVEEYNKEHNLEIKSIKRKSTAFEQLSSSERTTAYIIELGKPAPKPAVSAVPKP